jgi:hypothetical protein
MFYANFNLKCIFPLIKIVFHSQFYISLNKREKIKNSKILICQRHMQLSVKINYVINT